MGATMTIEEAAETLGCCRTRVFALIKDGTLTRARRFGRRTRVLSEGVAAALSCPAATSPTPRRTHCPATIARPDTDAEAIRKSILELREDL